jgi:hypothetical protein
MAPPPGPGQLCARCEVRGATRGQLPANTGRPRSMAREVRAGIAALEAAGASATRAAAADLEPVGLPLWRRVQMRARAALLGED